MNNEFAIATYGLTKQFERQIAVNDVYLQIERGEIYGLIGPNGAGKTTLIRILAMAEEATVGEIYLNGEMLSTEKNSLHLKRYLGYLPDDFPVYEDLTVLDYLDYFARLYHLKQPQRKERLHEVLEIVQLEYKRHASVATLSRGMKQRLSLARTIIHQPIILLLDEPVSGLDPIARMEFREVIKTLQKAGMTILISSHVLSDLAELCSSVGIMELGCLVESASLTDLYHRLSRQQIIISSLGEWDKLESQLRNFPAVEEWEKLPDGRTIKVYFSGSAEDSADLLKNLIEANIPLINFHCQREDLESIFLKLDHKQAS